MRGDSIMQYGLDIFPYKRLGKKDTIEKKEKYLSYNKVFKYAAYFLLCFLISRVRLVSNMVPFGIALLLAITAYLDIKLLSIMSIAVFLGYLSIFTSTHTIGIYGVIIATVLCLNYICKEKTKYIKLAIISFSIMIELLLNNLFISDLDFKIALLNSILEILCILPIYYVLDFGMLCFEKIEAKNLFNNEEIISMGIITSLIATGTWGINIYGISIMNILGLIVVLIIGYTCGSASGSATGVVMGVIMGMSTPNMLIFISVFGVCGLISGIFRETGKWLCAAACMIAFLIIQIYVKDINQFKIIEGIISCIVFLIISNKIYKIIFIDLDIDRKKSSVSKNYINNINNTFIEKLNDFSNVLFNFSNILNDLADNDKLVLKSKSSALVENLADRVCSNCDMKFICWKRELHYTYSSFSELIENFQEEKYVIPNEIERKCIKRTELMKNTEEIVNKHIINEMRKKSLTEGREIIASQINNVGNCLKEICKNIEDDVLIDAVLEKNIKNAFDRNKIKYNDVICFQDKNERITIKLLLKDSKDKKSFLKKVLPVINKVTNKTMCVRNEKTIMDINSNLCSVVIEELPKYQVTSYAAQKCKDGEQCSGDSYKFSVLKDGTFMAVMSDGMGSGPQAGRESQAAVNLVENYTNAGLSKITAINTVNSMMAWKFSEEEKFSTVDLCGIDLYTGKVDFMKVGAVPSFIKSGENIDVIKSKTLPMGVLDNVDVDIQSKQIKDGDYVIMLSDGALDYNDDNIGKVDWIIQYFKNNHYCDEKEIAHGLLNEAVKLSEYKVRDDITIIVSKIQLERSSI